MSVQTSQSGAVTGGVKWILRLEGLTIFLFAAFILKNFIGMGIPLYTMVLLFLAPDLSFLGYLISKRVGAICYNLMHSYITAFIFGYLFLFLGQYVMSTKYNFFPEAWNEMSIGYLAYIIMLIWIAHIGVDRALGFGLKYSEGFEFTHLGILKRFSSKK